jgi:hypothetical protein
MSGLTSERVTWLPQWRVLAGLICGLCGILDATALSSKLGDMDEDGVATIRDVVAILNHIHGRVPLSAERVSFADLNRDGVVNVIDANQVADAVVAALALADVDFDPAVTPTIPYTNLDRFSFSGSNFPMTRVRVSNAFGSVDIQSDALGGFSVEFLLPDDQLHDFYFSGYDASGSRLPPVPLSVLRDTEAPRLEVVHPKREWTTSSGEIVVCGRMSDSLSGDKGMSVTVNGVPATVFSGDGENGSFLSFPVGLNLGSNVLQVHGIDAAGNVSAQNLEVMRIPQERFRMVKTGGDVQEGDVGMFLTEDVSVKVTGPGGGSLVGKPVVFETVEGLGAIHSLGGGIGSSEMIALTDDAGVASIRWRMSTVAGKGNHLLRVRSRDIIDELVFVASANPSAAARLTAVGGDGQVAQIGSVPNQPLRVWANDGGNAISRKQILFQVLDGGGKVNGQDTFSVASSSAGFAEVQFSMGMEMGAQRVAASFVGETGINLIFTLHGIAKDSVASTSVDGFVLTPFFDPIPEARVELVVDGTRYGSLNSDAAGVFRFEGVAVGAAEVQVWLPEGSTSQTSPSKPVSTRRLYLAGRPHNALHQPLILPMTLNRKTTPFDGSSDVVLSLDGNTGFSMTVFAGSIRTSDGNEPSAAAPINLSLKQIPTSHLPFRPAHGESPRIAWLLEPSDLIFTSPPTMTIPDLTGLAGDSSVGLFGVNQQILQFNRFVSLGASGVPSNYQIQEGRGRIPAGFSFVNAGYHGGRATVTSRHALPPIPGE